MTDSATPPAPPVRRLGLIGAALALIALLVPISLDYRSLDQTWTLLAGGGGDAPTFALLWPIVTIVAGVAVFTVARLRDEARAATMAVVGLVGLLLALAPLGRTCAAPEAILPLLVLGLALGGTAAGARVLRPGDRLPRVVLAGAALLAIVALLIPLRDAAPALPGELSLYLDPSALTDVSPLRAYLDAVAADVMVGFLALWHLLPLVLLPAAAIAPPGPLLRALLWAIVLYIPLTYVLYAANIRGWTGVEWVRYRGHTASFDDFTRTAAIGRIHIAFAAAAYALWAQAGLTMLYAKLRRQTADPGPGA